MKKEIKEIVSQEKRTEFKRNSSTVEKHSEDTPIYKLHRIM